MNPLIAAGGFAAFSAASDLWGSFVSPRWTPSRYRTETAAWKADPCKYLELSDADWLYKNGFINRFVMNHTIGSNGYDFQHLEPHQLTLFQRGADGKIWINYGNLFPVAGHYPYDRLRITKKDFFTVDDIFTLVNREFITEPTGKYLLALKYQGEVALANKVMDLRYEIPPYTDLVHFAVKEAFNTEIIEAMGYNKELPAEIVPWMRKLGYGGESGFTIPRGATTTRGPETRTKAEWIDHIWYAHWQNMSPTQWYDALHRFYAASPRGPSPEFHPSIATSIVDVERGLKVDDYPEPLRKRLVALSYSPLTRIDARRMYDMEVLNDNELYHTYRAIGYNNSNAERLLQWNKKQKDAKTNALIKTRALKVIDKMAKQGAITLEQFTARMTELKFKPADITARWELLTSEALVTRIELVNKKVRYWYLNGSLDRDQAKTMLTGNGIMASVAEDTLAWLDQDRFFGRKFIAAKEAIEMMQNRLVTEEQVYNKLLNLGYTQPEATLILSNAKVNMTTKAQRALIKEQKRAALEQAKELKARNDMINKSIKEREAIRKEQIRNYQKRVDRALTAFSEKNIVKWAKNSTIDLETVETVLILKGWTPAAIRAFMITELGQKDYQPPEELEDEIQKKDKMQGNGQALLPDTKS